MISNTHPNPLHVLIAGGGVAALEAMIALRALAGERIDITLLAPDSAFRYRPLAVAEPFTIAHADCVPLSDVADDFGAELVAGALAGVDADAKVAITRAGERIAYDALVIACGTRARPAFPGAVTIDDRTLGEALRGLVQDVEDGYTREIAFVVPAQAFWPLPIYELALQTAQRAYDMNIAAEISIVTPETAPLTQFGAGISGELSRLLRDAGIAFHGSCFAEVRGGELRVEPSGARSRPQRVVALPLLDGPRLTGVPSDPHGFIAVGELGEVRGLDGVYAAGDATDYPIKHGGIAAQQADVVAAAIAARAGAAVQPQPMEPVLRGVLLTGAATRFLEAVPAADGSFSSTVSDTCPWGPPAKIAAAHLAPYLARGARHVSHA